jgi:hypothetical protein
MGIFSGNPAYERLAKGLAVITSLNLYLAQILTKLH